MKKQVAANTRMLTSHWRWWPWTQCAEPFQKINRKKIKVYSLNRYADSGNCIYPSIYLIIYVSELTGIYTPGQFYTSRARIDTST